MGINTTQYQEALGSWGNESVPSCPCGFVGPDCTETGFIESGAVFRAQVKSFPGGICGNGDTARTFGCFPGNDESAECTCKWGWEGALCLSPQTVKLEVLIVFGLIIPLLGLFSTVYFLRRGYFEKVFKRKEVSPGDLVEGRSCSLGLFVFRLCGFAFLTAVLVIDFSRLGTREAIWFQMRFFTYIMFLVSWVYFALAAAASSIHVANQRLNRVSTQCRSSSETNKRVNDDNELQGPSRLEQLCVTLLRTSMTCQLVVAVLFWAIVYPIAKHEGKAFLFIHFGGFVMHGGVFLMLFGDYWLTRIHVCMADYSSIVMCGSVYVLWHSMIMLCEYLAGIPHRPAYPFLSSSTYKYILWPPALCAAMFFSAHGALSFGDRYWKREDEHEHVKMEEKPEDNV